MITGKIGTDGDQDVLKFYSIIQYIVYDIYNGIYRIHRMVYIVYVDDNS